MLEWVTDLNGYKVNKRYSIGSWFWNFDYWYKRLDTGYEAEYNLWCIIQEIA